MNELLSFLNQDLGMELTVTGWWLWAGLAAIGLFIGTLTGLFGVGGGFLAVPLLYAIFGIPYEIAVGSSLCFITGTSSAGLPKYIKLGWVEPKTIFVLAIGSMILEKAIEWASRFALHQTKRQLYLANTYVAENPFQAQCLKVIRELKKTPTETLERHYILRKLKCKAAELDQIIDTMIQCSEIEKVQVTTKTKTAIGYRLIDGGHAA